MKRLFLTSQVHFVVDNIAAKLGDEVKKPMVFIDTCLKNRTYKDSELEWHFENKKKLSEAGFIYDFYDISGKSESQIMEDLSKYQAMYVEGGNTPYLLQQSHTNNFTEYVRSRVSEGMIYISTSAGSVIAGPDITPNGRPGKMPADYGITDPSGFKLVDFVILPHWGSVGKENDYLNHKIPLAYQSQYSVILLNDNQYVEVVDDWYRIVDITKE